MKKDADYESMTVFEQIKTGLEQAIAHRRGELTLKTTVLPMPAPRISKSRVRAIRKNAGMSQGVLAAYLNVPKRTLESWEQGRRIPKAGEARLLQLVEADPERFVSMVGDAAPQRSRRALARRSQRRRSG